MSDIYVFAGPVLRMADAQAELAAVYLPPAAEGDVYRLWRRRPRAIGIIDSPSEHVPPVPHKEIMWIMERGVHVFGSAGLGAVRAAELNRFGMRGVGWVYQAFDSRKLDRDDEVAVTHRVGQAGCVASSEAMVDIRRTLQAAQAAEIISAVTCNILTCCGAALFYADRTWPGLIEAGCAAGASTAELSALHGWLPAGYVNQQADDAVAMLREMRNFLSTNPGPLDVQWTMAHTTEWESQRRRADSLGVGGAAGSAFTLESILDEIRLLGPDSFEAIRCRSLLRHLAADIAEREGLRLGAERLSDAVAEFRVRNGLEKRAVFAEFLTLNDLSADEFEQLVVVDEKVRWACARAESAALEDLLADLRMHGRYGQLAARAREKLGSKAQLTQVDGDDSEQAAIQWYFVHRFGTAVPEDLAAYARSSGFPDELAFRRAVWREYHFICGATTKRQVNDVDIQRASSRRGTGRGGTAG